MTEELQQVLDPVVAKFLEAVRDPEIPVLSVVEMGIIRRALVLDGSVEIDVTPTYSGCPAMKVIEDGIVKVLKRNGFKEVKINTVYSPPWTTDWMSADAKRKLNDYGIAPPGKADNELVVFPKATKVQCPRCDSNDTLLKSQFGATSCKSLYICRSCGEPFEHFKAF